MKASLCLILLFFSSVLCSEEITAVLEPNIRKFISTRLNGVLLHSLEAGSRFSKGDVILSQPTASIEAEAEQIKLNLSGLKRELEYLEKLSERKKRQHSQGIIRLEEYETVLNELQKVKDKQKLYEIEKNKVFLTLSKSEVKADINGIVVNEIRKRGEYAREGERCLEIIDDSLIWAVFPYPHTKVKILKLESLKVSVGEKVHSGKELWISPEVDAASGFVQVKVSIDNSEFKHKTGQLCRISFNQVEKP